MIDRYQLRYFLAIVDTGNFSRAAAQMNVTQPTLSVGVAKLENQLGSRLFFRNNRRVYLTPAGSRFLEHARSIEREFDTLERGVSGAKSNRLIRLGIMTTISTRQVEQVIAYYGTFADRDRLEVIEGAERDLIARLDRDRIDLALMVLRPEPARFTQEHLYSEGYTLAVSANHRYAQAEAVNGEDLADETMMVRRDCEALQATSNYFIERGVRPEFSFRSANDDRVMAMVRAGLGVTVMPESHEAPGIAQPRLNGFNLRRDVGLVYGEKRVSLRDDGAPIVAALRSVLGPKDDR